jgi:endoribonuclease Nob1
MKGKQVVLDASGVLRSSLDFCSGGYLMPHSVHAEIRDDSARLAVDEAIRRGDIGVCEPGAKSLAEAEEAAKATGDAHALSRADLDVLALALETGGMIASDDYAIQNTAAMLSIPVRGTSQEGIKKEFRWGWGCGGCGAKMEGPGVCGICGHKARKRPAGSKTAGPKAAGPKGAGSKP